MFLTISIVTPTVNALWSFDSHINGENGIYHTAAVNGPTYVTGYTNQSNTAVESDGSSSQYVLMSSSFVD